MDPVKVPRRQEQARQTRRAVLECARDLFVAKGWEATTIDQIAAQAGVSRPTVFAVGSKAELLRLVRDLALAGDDEELTVSQRASAQQVLAEPDARRAADLLAEHVTAVVERYAPVDAVLRQAAGRDEELAALWRTSEEQRRTGAALFVHHLASSADLALPREQAVDVLWLLMAPDQYTRLVSDRGWPRRRFVAWLGSAIRALLLTEGGDTARGRR